MESPVLKHSPGSYPQRFNRFLWLLLCVKELAPKNFHLWQVMDAPTFEDTETALELELLRHGHSIDACRADGLILTVRRANRRDRNKQAAHI